jgi:trimeric autotransporter adhesin
MFRSALLVAFAGLLVVTPPASADVTLNTVPDRTAAADGRVSAIVRVGSTIFIGGSFTSITRKDGTSVTRHRLAAIDAATGDPKAWNPDADGPVRALAASPDGTRIFAGGDFTSVGGRSRRRLAKIDAASGSVSAWKPSVSSTVRALAVARGRVYAGGTFSSISGVAVSRMAALDMGTGAVVSGFSPRPDAGVRSLAVSSDGSLVYAGGSFTSIGGASRPYLAALSATNGRATSWKPQASRAIFGVALSPDGSRVFAGGAGSGGQLAAYDAGSAKVRWQRDLDGDVNTVAATSTTAYAGGHFHRAGGATRERLAAFDAGSGSLDPWNPGANSINGVYSLAVSTTRLHAGGEFTVIGGVPQACFASFSGSP